MPKFFKRYFNSDRGLLQGDLVIWAMFFLLSIISIVEVFSAASTLSYKSGDYLAPLFRQGFYLFLGAVVAWGFHCIPCRYFKLIPPFFYPVSVILLILTLFTGESINEGSRWLKYFGVSFQPSELAKGILVITVALILSYGQTEKGAAPKAMKYILIASGIVCGLILPENLSTAVILFTTVFLMMFIGRVPFRQLGRLVGALFLIGVAIVIVVLITPKETLEKNSVLHRMDIWISRVASFTGNHPNQEGLRDYQAVESEFRAASPDGTLTAEQDSIVNALRRNADARYLRDHAQEAHAKIAIASSNVVGKMPGNSEQRDYLSQAYSDFIFAIIVEELGIWGGAFVVFFYIVILFRTGRIASLCERNFPTYLAMGLAILLVLQAMVNMLVAVGLAPVTGQPLPLISRGGTSIVINGVYFGMILSVSRYARRLPEDTKSSKSDTAQPAELTETEKEAEAKKAAMQSDEGLV
ncbi:MAG: FtsW/RodA/SpoVE family cell cycle protein [Bacteroidales bacterium]|nr:FtsW/RodA/SpoVE family cell cycle protein [Bacteroidales bacterium]